MYMHAAPFLNHLHLNKSTDIIFLKTCEIEHLSQAEVFDEIAGLRLDNKPATGLRSDFSWWEVQYTDVFSMPIYYWLMYKLYDIV